MKFLFLIFISFITTSHAQDTCEDLLDFIIKSEIGPKSTYKTPLTDKVPHKKSYEEYMDKIENLIKQENDKKKIVQEKSERIQTTLKPLRSIIGRYNDIENKIDMYENNLGIASNKNDLVESGNLEKRLEDLMFQKNSLEEIYGKDLIEVKQKYKKASETFKVKRVDPKEYMQAAEKLEKEYGFDHFGVEVFDRQGEDGIYTKYEVIGKDKIRAYFDDRNKLTGVLIRKKDGFETLRIKDLASGCVITRMSSTPSKGELNAVSPEYCLGSAVLESKIKDDTEEARNSFYKELNNYRKSSLRNITYENYKDTQRICNKYARFRKIKTEPVEIFQESGSATIEN